MRYLQHLPLWRDANALLLAIEQAVRYFPRYHKYTLGSDLRRQAMGVCRLILRAWHARDDRVGQIERLIVAVDDLKLMVQLGKEIGAFASFSEFQAVAELAVALGRQSGGWRRRAGQQPPLQT